MEDCNIERNTTIEKQQYQTETVMKKQKKIDLRKIIHKILTVCFIYYRFMPSSPFFGGSSNDCARFRWKGGGKKLYGS